MNMIGQRFGKLLVKRHVSPNRFECLCDCGTFVARNGHSLRMGYSRSCGCLKKETNGTKRNRRFYEHEQINRERMEQLRNKFGYSKREISNILGKSGNSYHIKLNEINRFSRDEIEEIADLFFVDMDELLIKKEMAR